MKPRLLVLLAVCACAAFGGRFVFPEVDPPVGVSGCCAIQPVQPAPATAFAPKPKHH